MTEQNRHLRITLACPNCAETVELGCTDARIILDRYSPGMQVEASFISVHVCAPRKAAS